MTKLQIILGIVWAGLIFLIVWAAWSEEHKKK
jgi:hypothetical protein